MRKISGQLLYSPTDLVRYLSSPFASWMDRYHIENPKAVTPDEDREDERLIAQTGQEHERQVLKELRASQPGLVEIPAADNAAASAQTRAALLAKSPVIYQATLYAGQFAGVADFLILDEQGRYQVWDTKLARSPKPYYAIQLCCYADLLANVFHGPVSDRFGVILGTKERVEYRLEDFLHYYCRIKQSFLTMQDAFTSQLADRPEPLPRAEHRQWTSYAEKVFEETDHLVRVAGITVGQIKKLKKGGIATMTQLATVGGRTVPRLNHETFATLVAQANLQCRTKEDRLKNLDAPPRYELLSHVGPNGEPVGLAALPPEDPADVFFDMEGYPLAPGGLEYLFGACVWNKETWEFKDWWAHNRNQEKHTLESFVDWVYARWKNHPALHIYHYANYEVNAVRRLSTRHDTRQDEVDDLLRNNVFVDLYQIIRQSIRIGEDSYSIKVVERLYRPKRDTDVTTAADSIVQYNRWIETKEPEDWNKSSILRAIRQYNEDDCQSTAQLCRWLRQIARENRIDSMRMGSPSRSEEQRELPPEVIARQNTATQLRAKGDAISQVLGDLVDFHRREQKPVWWRMFERAAATPEERRDDPGCIEGIAAVGAAVPEKRSLLQTYQYEPAQECKLTEGDAVRFAHNLNATFTILGIDASGGRLQLKISKKSLDDKCEGLFPQRGALLADEFVNPVPIPDALAAVAARCLSESLHPPVSALLAYRPPATPMQMEEESTIDAAIRVSTSMSGGCLVIQGPPGTGKTFVAARVITTLLTAGKTVGITSNSHKAVINLMQECGKAAQRSGVRLLGIKVGGDRSEQLLQENPDLRYIANSSDARGAYQEGVVGGTAWLFSRPEWEGVLDYLFIDEAGQVSLANAVAMARSARNLILLGDQMQLEQPIQGSHPGDAGLSVLQYALKDRTASLPDLPVFHAIVPSDYGLFLGESRRMHPSVCHFISESMYEGRLHSHPDCTNQRIELASSKNRLITREHGIVFSPVEHDGNIQQSDEEVERVKAIFTELLERPYTAKDGSIRQLALQDFLLIAPYNAQVRALQAALPQRARVGSVDKFQGQEAPVCILSLCSSYGEYGSRGLAFILDRNRINVAISRAQCLAVVVADPRIGQAIPGTIEEMKLLNLFCKAVQRGSMV